ncbi:MAG TPA: aminotransferase class I/II-fold pyridoxal phosphate-dependent enzyme, partial [Clostridia bacterium]|nr:aminotransferase class I/II-fold pyridoxal phosphate-dependent enzyme [Clostridia bacterium]
MEQGSMTAGQAGGKQLMDPVFSVAGAAKEAMARYGPEGIINASIGTIYDDQGQLATFSAVNDLIKRMPASRMMDYAPIKGISGFAEAAIQFTFGQARPEAYLAAIATPGGTGGIRHVFYNYAGEGTRILIPDWYWGAYAVIAGEFGRRVDTFSLFTEKNSFNLGSFQEKVRELLQEQEHLVVVFNSPAHNPTGFSLSLDEWEAVLGFLREAVWDKTKKITILLDIAYMDYAGEAEEVREFFALFGGLPGNIFVAVAFSMSKAFLSYGLRCGA